MGWKCLVRLGVLGHAYYKLYNAFAEAAEGIHDSIADVSFFEMPDLNQARQMLHWAILAELRLVNERDGMPLDGFEEFPPAGLPVPFVDAVVPGSDEAAAEQLALMAAAYILHHELAHIYRDHGWLDQNNVDSLKRRIGMAKRGRREMWSRGKRYKKLSAQLQQEYTNYVAIEKDADTEAARWLLTGAPPDELWKRSLGVAIGLSWLAATDPYIGPTNSPAYPPGYDRLFQTIEQFIADPEDDVWAVIAFILVLHLQNARTWKENREGYTNFKEIANWATDLISKHSQFRAD